MAAKRSCRCLSSLNRFATANALVMANSADRGAARGLTRERSHVGRRGGAERTRPDHHEDAS
eukprot:3805964-Amphidinium_carterae.1